MSPLVPGAIHEGWGPLFPVCGFLPGGAPIEVVQCADLNVIGLLVVVGGE